jgi:hypothetical protein
VEDTRFPSDIHRRDIDEFLLQESDFADLTPARHALDHARSYREQFLWAPTRALLIQTFDNIKGLAHIVLSYIPIPVTIPNQMPLSISQPEDEPIDDG